MGQFAAFLLCMRQSILPRRLSFRCTAKFAKSGVTQEQAFAISTLPPVLKHVSIMWDCNTTSIYIPRIGLCPAVLGRTSHFISGAVQTYAALEYPAAQLVLPLSIQTTSIVLPWRRALLAPPQVCIH